MPEDDEGNERKKSDDGKESVISGEHAVGGTGIAPMNEFEETLDHDFLLLEPHELEDQEFGQLVEGKDGKSHQSHARVMVQVLQ